MKTAHAGIASWRRHKPGVIRVDVHARSKRPDWPLLLMCDVHFDSKYCNRPLLKRFLDEVKKRNGAVIFAGDTFDAMQGRFDKRSCKDSIRPEYVGGRDEDSPTGYYNRIVDDAADFFAPYADNIIAFGDGNHETAVYKQSEYPLTPCLAAKVNERGKPEHPVIAAGYQGWLWMQFRYNEGRAFTRRLKFHHGYGGGGNGSRALYSQLLVNDNVDYLFMGHVHRSWSDVVEREYLDEKGQVRTRRVYLIQGPTLKNEFKPGGWATEKGIPPKPLGAWWVRFNVTNDGPRHEIVRAEE